PVNVTRIFPDGTKKALHSSYDPVKEASRFIDSCGTDDSLNFIVGGFGLGYHLIELVQRVPRQSRIVIFENDPEMLVIALMHNDLGKVLEHPGISIHVGIAPNDLPQVLSRDKTSFTINGFVPITFSPLIVTEFDYYQALHAKLDQLIQETWIDLKTHAAFSKLFYKNLTHNFSHLVRSPGVQNLQNQLSGFPAIIVSAGPSLDKNISLLKDVAERSVLIAVATALKPLLEANVEPDFVVAIDPDDTTINAFDLNSAPEKTWLLYDPCIPSTIPKIFNNKNIVVESNFFLAQWIANFSPVRGTLGKTFSVAHTAFLFAKHLGCSPIILVGQDLAFTHHRMHCTASFFYQKNLDSITSDMTLVSQEKKNYQKYLKALKPATDLHGEVVTTTLSMDTYKNVFAEEIQKGISVINATEGGIPIPGATNLCLREASYIHCNQYIKQKENLIRRKLKVPHSSGKLYPALEETNLRFKKLNHSVSDLKNRYPGNELKNDSEKIIFVEEMERLYSSLLKEPDIMKMLQEFSFLEFMEWNQKNHKIILKMARNGEKAVLEDKFQRDQKLLTTLLNSTEYIEKAFCKMVETISPQG
ncbi:MAG: motility associated factor glycosyltransferase family protein, partial [Nitrospinales bacterium]